MRSGKARYIGASSMCAWQFAKALHLADRHGWTRFVSMQNHYNLVYREEEREMLPLCREEGDRRDSVEPAGARLSRRQPPGRRQGRRHARAKTDDIAHKLYYADSDFRIVDRVVDRGQGGAASRPRRSRSRGSCTSRA